MTAERDKQIALGEKLFNKGNLNGAEACFRLAVEADPESAQAHAQLAWCLVRPEQSQEAVEHLRIAARLDPSSEKVLETLGVLLARLGQFQEAEEVFKAALLKNPGSATALGGLVGCRKMREADRPLVQRMAQLAEAPDRSPKLRAVLHRSAGKAYDDLGDYAQAMRHFDASNAIAESESAKAGRSFQGRELELYTDLCINTFTAERMAQPLGVGSPSELPVLIVGMIRSGTTLLDEILSRHPQIASAGEINYWTGFAATQIMRDLMGGRINLEKAREVSQEYRVLLRQFGPSEARVIDKMPMNFMGLGLVHLLFPNARILHTRRNPLDTCLSIYVTDLGFPRVNFAVSRANIVFMYRQYRRLMAHWRTVIPPDRLLDVDYESLVSDPEPTMRRAVEFLGLPWDPVCLQAGQVESLVTTPSMWQARQPIYKSSVERWRRYEPWLGELRSVEEEPEALEPKPDASNR